MKGYVVVTIERNDGDGLPSDMIRCSWPEDQGDALSLALWTALNRMGYMPLVVAAGIIDADQCETGHADGHAPSSHDADCYAAIRTLLDKVKTN